MRADVIRRYLTWLLARFFFVMPQAQAIDRCAPWGRVVFAGRRHGRQRLLPLPKTHAKTGINPLDVNANNACHM